MKRTNSIERKESKKLKQDTSESLQILLEELIDARDNGNLESVLRLTDEILHMDNKNLKVYETAFAKAYALGNYEIAIPYALSYLDISPDDHFLRVCYADSLLEMDRITECGVQCEILLRALWDLSADVKFRFARMLFHGFGDVEYSIPMFEDIAKNGENDIENIHYFESVFMAASHEPDHALETFEYSAILVEGVKNGKFEIGSGEIDAALELNAFHTIFERYDKDAFDEIMDILSNRFEKLTMMHEDAFENWAKLFPPHKALVKQQHPNIVKALQLYSDLQKELLYSVEVAFSKETMNEIHSFLFLI